MTKNLERWLPSDTNVASFFIEAGSMQLAIDGANLTRWTLSGSNTENEHQILIDRRKSVVERIRVADSAVSAVNDSISLLEGNKNYNAGRIATLNKRQIFLDSLLNSYSLQFRRIDSQFFCAYPTSVVTVFQLSFYANVFDLPSMAAFVQKMGETVGNSRYGKRLLEKLAFLTRGRPESVAYNFSFEVQGKQKQLYDLKEDYVLLVFWASWCKPCREENRELDSLYNTFRRRGLSIRLVAISDDDETVSAWQSAIRHDGITGWTHVLRGKNRSDIFDKYGISVLPTKILVNSKRLIVYRFDETENDRLIQALNSVRLFR